MMSQPKVPQHCHISREILHWFETFLWNMKCLVLFASSDRHCIKCINHPCPWGGRRGRTGRRRRRRSPRTESGRSSKSPARPRVLPRWASPSDPGPCSAALCPPRCRPNCVSRPTVGISCLKLVQGGPTGFNTGNGNIISHMLFERFHTKIERDLWSSI